MPIPEDEFIEVDEKWNEGVALNFYDGKISIVAANRSGDGNIWYRKCFAIKKSGKPADKPIPWKVNLGFPEDAFQTLMMLAAKIREKYGAETHRPGDPVPRPLVSAEDVRRDPEGYDFEEPPF